jgi:hypothetical protein
MGDEFNMGMPGEPQIGLPGNHHLAKQIQESGLQMNLTGLETFAIGAGINLIGGLIGGNKSASAARSAANAQNEAAHRQLEYDTELWGMNKDKILADREQAIATIETQAKNEFRLASYKDATAAKRYNYDMMIRNREQTSLNQQYRRSDDIYWRQLDFNDRSAKAAREDEIRQLGEIQQEANFDANEAYVDQLLTEGKIRARGITGRGAKKLKQTTLYEVGSTYAKIDQSLVNASRNSRAILEEIARDKSAADLQALAAKMLDPGVLPLPIVPYKTPMAQYIYPREIGEYDFGPKPVVGALASPSAAANQAWGAAISGIASGVGSAFAATKWN